MKSENENSFKPFKKGFKENIDSIKLKPLLSIYLCFVSYNKCV